MAQLVGALSRKVAGSIADVVIRIFHWLHLSGHTLSLEQSQLLPQISTRNVSWEVKVAVLGAHKLTTFVCRLSRNFGSVYLLDT